MKQKIDELINKAKYTHTVGPGGTFSHEPKFRFTSEELNDLLREVAKVSWFEGMQQGVIFDHNDRIRPEITPTKPVKRTGFDEWFDQWLSEKGGERPKCDECGKPLTGDESETCEDCLCPE